jgi:hypothetical protein
VTVNV